MLRRSSTRVSELLTATLLRCPGSRLIALISITPSLISGISCSNRRLDQLRLCAAEDHLNAISGRLNFVNHRANTIPVVVAFARDLLASWQNCFDARQRHCSHTTLAALYGFQSPIAPLGPWYSSIKESRSASLIFWMMTCLAV